MTNHPPDTILSPRKPDWLKVKFPSQDDYFSVSALLQKHGLNTICRSAQCPNRAECWTERTATFLILGDVCTRNCAFCAVTKGAPVSPATDEPERVAEAAASLGLRYVVVTSVTRDDLPDGGAAHFAARHRGPAGPHPRGPGRNPHPRLRRSPTSACAPSSTPGPTSWPTTWRRSSRSIPGSGGPAAGYRRSLEVLRRAKALGAAVTKSGLMIGLGETEDELRRTLRDLREAGCDLLTIGQYLRPSEAHAPVARYYTPDEFAAWSREALALGFAGVESGPLVRSSFHAHKLHAVLAGGRGSPACAT